MQVLTRIIITETGDLIVTDLWNEIQQLLGTPQEYGFEITDTDL